MSGSTTQKNVSTIPSSYVKSLEGVTNNLMAYFSELQPNRGTFVERTSQRDGFSPSL